MKTIKLLGIALLSGLVLAAFANEGSLPAFPGAEGFGAFTAGGRGGKVLFVTTLEDYDSSKGEAPISGSFREAIESRGPRYILFRVAGTIYLKRTLILREPFATIAGQSAPGDGICIARNLFRIESHDVILRYLRFRLGDVMQAELDTVEVSQSQNVILDHCSISWSMDENCTMHGVKANSLTIQWCLISESLNRSYHPKGEHGHGSLLRSEEGAFTVHHSIYAHNHARNPRPGGYGDGPGLLLDFRNNVIYDWGSIAGYSGLERTRLNYVGNYFKPGPSTDREARPYGFSARSPNTKIYLANNAFEGSTQKTTNNWLLVRKWGEWDGKLEDSNGVPEPFPAPPLTMDTADIAFEKVLAQAGATLPRRDSVDTRVIIEIREGKGRIIDSQKEVGGWPDLKSSQPAADEDTDGMPDDWEKRFGLNAANPADAQLDPDGDGYENLEEFLNQTDPKTPEASPRFDLAGLTAQLKNLNAKSRAEIAEALRHRPANAGSDGSAPPPLQKLAVREGSQATQKFVVVQLASDHELRMNWIPAGTFMMGSPDSEPERGKDEVQHRVTISKPYYMGATLVTALEYSLVMGSKPTHGGEGELPAEVTWPDAVRFCETLSRDTGRKFRLPTEAEWEYACRAGTTTPFNTGDTISTEQANFDGKFVYPGGKLGEYRRKPTPVRTFAPNAWGLHDMHGNAYQWCSDWYGPYRVEDATDPVGATSGSNRVIRGGKYGSGARYIRSAARYCYSPNNSSVVFGFRVVMDAQPR